MSLRIRSVVVPALALVVVSLSALASAKPADAAACWERVITDWRDGRIDGTYSPQCLRAALEHLPEDLRVYGSAEEEITRVLNATQARQLAPATSPAKTGAASGQSTTTQADEAAPASGSRSLSGRKPKARPEPAHRVAAAPERASGDGFPYRTLLLILSAVSAASVVALASARGFRG